MDTLLLHASVKMVPREIENSAYAKCWRKKKEYLTGIFEKGPLIKSTCEYILNKLSVCGTVQEKHINIYNFFLNLTHFKSKIITHPYGKYGDVRIHKSP